MVLRTPRVLLGASVVLLLASCAAERETASEARPRMMDVTAPPDVKGLATGEVKPPSPEEAAELLEKEGGNWFYGPGLGSTMLNVGACVLFPPYALYLLMNYGLEASGYEPLYVTDALPEGPRDGVKEVYREVTSVPGKVTSAVAGEEFRQP